MFVFAPAARWLGVHGVEAMMTARPLEIVVGGIALVAGLGAAIASPRVQAKVAEWKR